jgi:hypothetical protein
MSTAKPGETADQAAQPAEGAEEVEAYAQPPEWATVGTDPSLGYEGAVLPDDEQEKVDEAKKAYDEQLEAAKKHNLEVAEERGIKVPPGLPGAGEESSGEPAPKASSSKSSSSSTSSGS